jgi:hypothetical protein
VTASQQPGSSTRTSTWHAAAHAAASGVAAVVLEEPAGVTVRRLARGGGRGARSSRSSAAAWRSSDSAGCVLEGRWDQRALLARAAAGSARNRRRLGNRGLWGRLRDLCALSRVAGSQLLAVPQQAGCRQAGGVQ